MRIAAWNVNHRTNKKKIPQEALQAVESLDPDVLVLNEYVDSDKTERFKKGLEGLGYTNISVSEKLGRHNQILIASRAGHAPGEIAPPERDKHSKSNFLHVVMDDSDLEIIGLRVPFYRGAGELRGYWDQLREIINGCAERKILFIGDFNDNPENPGKVTGRHLAELRSVDWGIPSPEGEWSYISNNGKDRSKIDHVVLSPLLGRASVSYHNEAGGVLLADVKANNPISDHAVLVVDF